MKNLRRKLGIACIKAAAIWLLSCFLNKWKTKFKSFGKSLPEKIFITWQLRKKESISFFRFITWQWSNKGTSRNHDWKRSVYKQPLAAPRSVLNSLSQKQYTSFSYQRSISTTKPHDLQLYCFLGQTHLHQICWLWKMSRQNSLILLVQKRFQVLVIRAQSVQERCW